MNLKCTNSRAFKLAVEWNFHGFQKSMDIEENFDFDFEDGIGKNPDVDSFESPH